MIKLEFEFKTIEEVAAFLSRAGSPRPFGEVGAEKLARAAVPVLAPQAVVLNPNATASVTSAEPAETPAPKKRGRAAAPDAIVTREETFKALETLINTKGYDAGRAVLKAIGAARFPDVKPEQYQALVDACERA